MTQRNSTGPERDLWGLPTARTGHEPAGAPAEGGSARPSGRLTLTPHLDLHTCGSIFKKFSLECCTFGHVCDFHVADGKIHTYNSANVQLRFLELLSSQHLPTERSLRPSLAGNIIAMSR